MSANLSLNKIFAPYLGAILAAFLFLWQKTLMIKTELNYSKDVIRGSI